jgi:hypothetical protein
MIYKITKVDAPASTGNITYLRCFTSENIGIIFWGNHPVGDKNILLITASALPIILELNAIELEAPYRVQADFGVIISVPSDHAVKFLLRVV